MDEQSELRDGYAEIGDVRLHYVEAGEAADPSAARVSRVLVRLAAADAPLAAAGFRVVAPDLRGYNVSSKPDDVAAYDTDKLATTSAASSASSGRSSARGEVR